MRQCTQCSQFWHLIGAHLAALNVCPDKGWQQLEKECGTEAKWRRARWHRDSAEVKLQGQPDNESAVAAEAEGTGQNYN